MMYQAWEELPKVPPKLGSFSCQTCPIIREKPSSWRIGQHDAARDGITILTEISEP